MSPNPVNDMRKYPRHKVLKGGKLVSSDMNTLVDVRIRDLSAKGARVIVAASVQIPEKFNFLIVAEDLLYPAVAKWRVGDILGIEFTGEARSSLLRKLQ